MQSPRTHDSHCCDSHLVEQAYLGLFDHYPEMMCIHQDRRLVYLNPAGVKWLGGTTEKQFIGRRLTDFVHPDSVPAMSARIASLQAIGDTTNPAELILRRADGRSLFVQSVSVLTVWQGKPASQVILRDLSGHATAEEAQRYRQLIDHCPDMICVHQDGQWVYMNPAGVRWLGGTSVEQFVGRPITEFVHPDSVPAMLARIASLLDVGDATKPAEAIMLRLDGTAIDVESVSVLTVWQGRPAYQVVLRDMSAQKAVEATLRYQAALVDHVSDAVIATTFDGIVTSWNPAAEAIYRRPREWAVALPVSETVGAPLDPGAVVIRGGLVETTHHRADGAALAMRVSVAEMDDGFVLLCSDQTARRRAEQHFQSVVTSLEEGVVVVVGSDGRIESVNPAAGRVLGICDPTAPTSISRVLQRFRSANPMAKRSTASDVGCARFFGHVSRKPAISSASNTLAGNGAGCRRTLACSTRRMPTVRRFSSRSQTSPPSRIGVSSWPTTLLMTRSPGCPTARKLSLSSTRIAAQPAQARLARCCLSTWTASRGSTTRTVTVPGTTCCKRQPNSSGPRCDHQMLWAGSAATNSSS
jgi:PAS domain S-box-containing protein